MCEPQELRLEQEPAMHQRERVMHADIRQQLEGIWQQLLALRQEVGDTRQQLVHLQAEVSTLYGLSQCMGPHHMSGLRQGTLLVYVLLTPGRWLLARVRRRQPQVTWLVHVLLTPGCWLRVRMRRGRQVMAKLRPLRAWSTFYWALFGLVLWRGRMRGIARPEVSLWRNITASLRGRRKSRPQAPRVSQTASISQPVNLLSRNTAPAKLQEDVKYAIQIGQGYLNLLAASQLSPHGKVVLEIGPGINYGSILVLACYGAQAMVTDRFLAPWDPDYHPLFYTLLQDAIREHMPEADVRPIKNILSHGGYTPQSIRCYTTALEALANIPTASVDIIFSNAVLEHIYDPPTAFESLARISKPEGRGFHQVDFRDHRCMERPLEFLLMSEAEFAQEFAQCHGECGNRYRPWEYAQLFERAGFQVLQFEPSAFADATYLAEFIPRLRATEQAKDRYTEAERLKVVSGYYVVTRTATT